MQRLLTCLQNLHHRWLLRVYTRELKKIIRHNGTEGIERHLLLTGWRMSTLPDGTREYHKGVATFSVRNEPITH